VGAAASPDATKGPARRIAPGWARPLRGRTGELGSERGEHDGVAVERAGLALPLIATLTDRFEVQ
jgi:hypothetical protein